MRYCNGFRLALLLVAVTLGGCSGLPYYSQAVGGEMATLARARPISHVLDDRRTAPALRARLRFVERVLRFARRTLHLPVHGNYQSYANLHRPYAVWNVFAARPLSLQLKRWCFPIAGCVAYRGYFSRQAAQRYARRLAHRGYDVYVGGVPAYATLGYLPDPVLNTFIGYQRTTVAHLLFHELAHDLLYVPGATAFDESFADTVADVGVERLVRASGDLAWRARYRRRQRYRRAVLGLLRATHHRLAILYAGHKTVAQKLAAKRRVLASLRAGFRRLTRQWGGTHGYGRFFARNFNNALLGALASYADLRPAFRRLLALEQGHMRHFYAAVRWYSRLPASLRDRALKSRSGLVGLPAFQQVQRGPLMQKDTQVVRPHRARLPLTVHHGSDDKSQSLQVFAVHRRDGQPGLPVIHHRNKRITARIQAIIALGEPKEHDMTEPLEDHLQIGFRNRSRQIADI